jgi:small subunit ribosomal protein S16
MVVIRLRREGALNRPYYKVVVADRRCPRDGKFIELVGSFDPLEKNQERQLKLDRIDYWLSVGAKPTERVNSLILKSRRAAAKAGEEAPSAPAEAAAS